MINKEIKLKKLLSEFDSKHNVSLIKTENNINGITEKIVELFSEENTKDNTCSHNWKHGYTLEPVVFCTKCNKDADEVYKGMPYNEQCRLVLD